MLGALLILAGVNTLIMTSGTGRINVGAATTSLPIMAAGIFVIAMLRRKNKVHATLRREFLQKHPVDEANPRVATLSAAWRQPGRPPKLKDVQAALAETSANDQLGARIVNFGEPDVPDVGEMHFEPEIITPTGAIWKRLSWVLVGVVLLGLWLLDYLGWLPEELPSIRRFSGGFMYLFVMAVGVFITWVWRSAIRPTYIRMAPGIIQVLEYRYSRSKPTIRGYPMEAGTLAVFTRVHKNLVLTLTRDGNKDVLSFSRMRHPEQRIERAWQALLSTAPAPPLSDEELVG